MKTAAALIEETEDARGWFPCRRCGGLMVPERLEDLALLGFNPAESWGWRCVACGEVVDPLILQHRHRAAAMRE